jgi:predicted metal-dependent phosphoesterase TrpH
MDKKLVRVEFHCHTQWSKDSLLNPRNLVDACRKKRIDKVIITDHNSIRGGLEGQQYAPEMVIVGEEIKTTQGEILAAFVGEEIPAGLEPNEVIHRLRDQGAFISVSHPFDRIRSGAWNQVDLDRIIDLVDAIEVFNARCWYSEDNHKALAYAQLHKIPGTAGSDAHVAFELGAAGLELEDFNSADELRSAIQHAQVYGKLSSRWVHLTSRWAVFRKELTASRQHS